MYWFHWCCSSSCFGSRFVGIYLIDITGCRQLPQMFWIRPFHHQIINNIKQEVPVIHQFLHNVRGHRLVSRKCSGLGGTKAQETDDWLREMTRKQTDILLGDKRCRSLWRPAGERREPWGRHEGLAQGDWKLRWIIKSAENLVNEKEMRAYRI